MADVTLSTETDPVVWHESEDIRFPLAWGDSLSTPASRSPRQLSSLQDSPRAIDATFFLGLNVVDPRTPSPGLRSPSSPHQASLPVSGDDFLGPHSTILNHDPFAASNSLADLDFRPGELRIRMLFDVPWLLFRDTLNLRLIFSQSSDPLQSSELGDGLNVEQRKKFLFELSPRRNQASPLTAQTFAHEHELVAILEQTVPSRFPPVGNQILSQFLQLPRRSAMYQFTELAFGLVSNNMVSDQGMKNLLGFITRHISRETLHDFFSIDTITTKAVADKLLETAVRCGDEPTLLVLLSTGANRERVSGLHGTRLLQLAIEEGHSKLVGCLLREGANPNPEEMLRMCNLEYETPLHAAVCAGDPDLVRSLLGAGAEVDRFDECSALAHAVEGGHLACASLLLDAEADVEKAWLSDIFGDGDFLHNHSAIDHAFLTHNTEMFELFSTHINQDQSCLSISGILLAAQAGVQQLRYYLQLEDRDNVEDSEREYILNKALTRACCYPGHEAAAGVLLEFGVDPNSPPGLGSTPLEWAVRRCSVYAVGHLLNAGAKITEDTVKNAMQDPSLLMLNILIENGATPTVLRRYGLPAALRGRNMSAFMMLLQQIGAAALDGPLPSSEPLIQTAVKFGYLEAVKLLIQHGADRNTVAMGQAAYSAARNGQLEILNVLIGSGVQANDLVHPGVTLLEGCAQSGSSRRSDVFRVLLEAGAEMNYSGRRYRECNSLLTELISNGWDDVHIRLVLEAGVEVNDRGIGAESRTPIQAAACRGNLGLVKELHGRGADINASAGLNYQRTALQAACNAELVNMELVNFLLGKGANVNAEPGVTGGVTALQGAAIRGHTNLALLLIDDYKADVNAKPAIWEGRTALEGAAEHGRLDLVQILLNAGAKPREGSIGFNRAISLAIEGGHWAVASLLGWVPV